jgi:hypothetical protein
MGYDSKGILVFNLKYEHAINFINLVKFINYYQMPRFSKLSIDLFFKLPVSRFLAINIEGNIGQLTVRRTSTFNMRQAT